MMKIGSHISPCYGNCSADEYFSGDNSLPVLMLMAMTWMNSLTEVAESVDDDEVENFDAPLPT